MATFRFFNPWSVLENANSGETPTKVANLAKVADREGEASSALAGLAGLATARPIPQICALRQTLRFSLLKRLAQQKQQYPSFRRTRKQR